MARSGDGDDGYDRSDEDDDFARWSDRLRAASVPAEDELPAKKRPKTLTERLADAKTERDGAASSDAASTDAASSDAASTDAASSDAD